MRRGQPGKGRGSLIPGKQADVVLLDEELDIRGIVKDGVVVKTME